jgi:hypothetical protein
LLSKLRTHAPLAVALMALFFAIGGPSFAADAVSHAARLLTGKQIKDSSLTTRDVKNGSLLKADFKAGQLPSGPQGPKGDQGIQGPKGDKGDAGRSALSPLQTGETVRGVIGSGGAPTGGPLFHATFPSLPVPAPVALENDHVLVDGQDDPLDQCTGSYADSTAPAGYVCIYLNFISNASGIGGFVPNGEPTKNGFGMFWTTPSATAPYVVEGDWAYTAP